MLAPALSAISSKTVCWSSISTVSSLDDVVLVGGAGVAALGAADPIVNRSSPEVDDGGGFADSEPDPAELAAALSSAPRSAPRLGAAGAAAWTTRPAGVGRADPLPASWCSFAVSSWKEVPPDVRDVVRGVADEVGVTEAIARQRMQHVPTGAGEYG